MENLNLVELLRDCPQGMKLYSPIFGDVYLDKIRPHLAIVVTTDKEQGNLKEEFLYDGRYRMNGECMIFPSKGKTTWEGFVPFVKGDIIYTDGIVAILCSITESGTLWYYCYYSISEDRCKIKTDFGIGNVKDNELRLATEEEKQKLFDAIKANGYRWNAETKTLEELKTFKFAFNSIIRPKGTDIRYRVVGQTVDKRDGFILKAEYRLRNIIDNSEKWVNVVDEDNYELVPNKFDITTLKPFDKVFVRDNNTQEWVISFFSHCNELEIYKYSCINGHGYAQCVPYEENKHLLGTTNDCDDFYKTWEK